jgi:hypothetical protein
MAGPRQALAIGAFIAALAACTAAQAFTIVGACRNGQPNGAYELRMEDGRLLVAGAFAYGRKTGTFIFWSEGGARVAVMPYDEDSRSGTVALWYVSPGASVETARRLEAPYVHDRLNGLVRSWYATGAPKAEERYENGQLVDAQAWTEAGMPIPEPEARALAGSDAEADQRLCDTLLALVRDNLPRCD